MFANNLPDIWTIQLDLTGFWVQHFTFGLNIILLDKSVQALKRRMILGSSKTLEGSRRSHPDQSLASFTTSLRRQSLLRLAMATLGSRLLPARASVNGTDRSQMATTSICWSL